MSNLKFSCPSCQQHIECEPSYSGVEIDCPNCSTRMVVPPAQQLAPSSRPSLSVRSTPCPGCGSAIAGGSHVCTRCGFNLRTGNRPEPQPALHSATTSASRRQSVRERAASQPGWGIVWFFLGFFLVGLMNVYAAGIYLGVVSIFLLVIANRGMDLSKRVVGERLQQPKGSLSDWDHPAWRGELPALW